MSWVVENTLTALALAVAVAIGCRLFRPRPALVHVLWLVVLCKLCCPPLLRWSVPIAAPALLAETPAPILARPVSWVPATAAAEPARSTLRPRPEPSDPRSWLLALWAVGTALVSTSMLCGIRRAGVRVRAALPAPPWLIREVGELAGRIRVAMPEVRVAEGISSAFVWSLGRPLLVCPAALLERGRLGELRGIAAHELAHLRRRDHWVARAELLAAAVFWWHPLFWFARARMRHSAELACDAWTVWAVPAARRDYAGALIDTIEMESHAVRALPVLGARASACRAFEKRLLMILHADVPRRLSRWALLPVAALSLVVLSGPSFAQSRNERGQDPAKVSKQRIDDEILRLINERLRAHLGREYQIEDLSDLDDRIDAFVRARKQGQRPERSDDRVRRVEIGGAKGLGDALREGLAEALREVRDDEDLRELGIAGDVEDLLRAAVSGQGLDGEKLGRTIRTALSKGLDQGLGEARAELRAEGFDAEFLDQIGPMIEAAISGRGDAQSSQRFERGLRKFIGQAAGRGLGEARRELRAEGIEDTEFLDHLGALIQASIEGRGDAAESSAAFEKSLIRFIRGAVRQGLREARAEAGDGEAELIEGIEKVLEDALSGQGDVDTDALQRGIERLIRQSTGGEQRRERDQDEGAGRRRRVR